MREEQLDQEQEGTSAASVTSVTGKERERKRQRFEKRLDGDSDNPQICRGVD
jgi:hypothetical protein